MAKDIVKLVHHLVLVVFYLFETIVWAVIPLKWRPRKDVSDEIVLITGGGNGLGRKLAVEFAKLGAIVVSWDINQKGNEETKRLVEKVGGVAHVYTCDVSDRHRVYEVAKLVKAQVGTVTILINNAGIVIGKTMLNLEDDDIQKVFDINAVANFWTAKAFLPDMMKANHGHVVNMSSISGVFGVDLFPDYSSSKHALNGFDECLKLELIRNNLDGVHTTLVCPFLIRGGFFDGIYDGVVDILDTDYAIGEIMLAILTNAEVIYLPKFLYILALMRPIVSRKMLFHFQNFMADRSMASNVVIRKLNSTEEVRIKKS